MRLIEVQIDKGKGEEVLKIAQKLEGKNMALSAGSNLDEELDIVTVSLSNSRVEDFISEITKLDNAKITLIPQGIMALYPPAEEAPEQVKDVQLRSPIEIFLAGLQSIGSWKGFLAYTVISSIVVWIGLYTNTTYLLVGAMLIAPFAGPAMNTAIATSRGDLKLLKRSLIRYFTSIFLMIGLTALLSIILKQEVATGLMVDSSQISSVVVLVALAAGAAGAVNLIQSERDSLVSGAAVGMLVAASLAPPAGVTGMAIALAQWDMVKSGVFLLLLQLIGINFTGAIIFKMAGLTTKGTRYKRGKKSTYYISLGLTALLLAVIMFWQFNSKPELERSSVSRRVEAIIQKTINKHEEVGLVETTARFTRANIEGQNTLLCNIYLQKLEGQTDKNILNKNLKQELIKDIKNEYKDVTPIIVITIIENNE